MKTNEEQVEELLGKPYESLDASERELVFEVLGSEEQFKLLQNVHNKLQKQANSETIAPDSGTLNSLLDHMRERRRAESLVAALFRLRVPAYAALLAVVVVAGLMASLSRPTLVPVMETKLRIDTVYRTKTEIIVKEKTVIRYVRIPVPVADNMITASSKAENHGVSMKDKQELDGLLVGIN